MSIHGISFCLTFEIHDKFRLTVMLFYWNENELLLVKKKGPIREKVTLCLVT